MVNGKREGRVGRGMSESRTAGATAAADGSRETDAVHVDGHRIQYVATGPADGHPVLLLHGGIIDAGPLTWGPVLDALGDAGYRVVAPDMLGYGDSDAPDVTYTLERQWATVAGVIDALDLDVDGLSLAGVSMGGAVAVGVHLETDVDVERLALVDSYGLGRELANGRLTYLLSRTTLPNKLAVALFRRSRRAVKLSLAGLVHDPDSIDPEFVDAVQRYARKPTACVAFRSFRRHEVTRDGYRTCFRDRFADVSVPTLFVHGEHDDLFPVEWSRRAAEAVPGGECAVYDDAAHLAPREAPERLVADLREFLPRP